MATEVPRASQGHSFLNWRPAFSRIQTLLAYFSPQKTKVQQASPSASLRGQTLHAPSWGRIFDHWYSDCNPLYSELIQYVDEILERHVKDPVMLMKLKKTDFALFISRWWPKADRELLRMVTLYTLWMFLFDDTIDAEIVPGETSIASNLDMATQFRTTALDFIKYELGLVVDGETAPAVPDMTCELFQEVSPFFRERMSQTQVQDFWHGLQVFIESNAPEQEQRLSGKVPTVKEFYTWRMGTTAIDSMCALGFAMSGAKTLPSELAEEDQILRDETNRNTIYVNDILSLKKEIKDDTLVNLVVITMKETDKDLNTVIDLITDQMREGGRNFDQAAARMRFKAKALGPEVLADANKAIEAYELIMTSVWTWTMESPRYGLEKFRQEDGSFSIPL